MPEWLSDRARPAPGEARSATLALELTATGWFGSRPCAARGLKRAETGLFRQYGVFHVESLSARPFGALPRHRNSTPRVVLIANMRLTSGRVTASSDSVTTSSDTVTTSSDSVTTSSDTVTTSSDTNT